MPTLEAWVQGPALGLPASGTEVFILISWKRKLGLQDPPTVFPQLSPGELSLGSLFLSLQPILGCCKGRRLLGAQKVAHGTPTGPKHLCCPCPVFLHCLSFPSPSLAGWCGFFFLFLPWPNVLSCPSTELHAGIGTHQSEFPTAQKGKLRLHKGGSGSVANPAGFIFPSRQSPCR